MLRRSSLHSPYRQGGRRLQTLAFGFGRKIHPSAASAIFGNELSTVSLAVRSAAEDRGIIWYAGPTQPRIWDTAGSACHFAAHHSCMCLSRAAWFAIGGPEITRRRSSAEKSAQAYFGRRPRRVMARAAASVWRARRSAAWGGSACSSGAGHAIVSGIVIGGAFPQNSRSRSP